MPSVTEPTLPVEDPRSSRLDLALALLLGAALLGFGWADMSSYLGGRHKVQFTFSLNMRPGGVRVGEVQEFFRDAANEYVRLENFTPLETLRSTSYRHNLGPVSTMEIVSPHSRAQLRFRFDNLIADEDLTVACNGQPLEQITHLPIGTIIRLYSLDLHPGSNVVTFTCRRYNHDGTENDPNEARPIAGTFGALDLLLE